MITFSKDIIQVVVGMASLRAFQLERVVSLLVSGWIARQLVRPIDRLLHVPACTAEQQKMITLNITLAITKTSP